MTGISSQKEVVLEGLTMKFPARDGRGEVLAVDHISLDVRKGELVTLLGPSGCGKTTTLRLIAGFETPTEGRIYIGGRVVNDIPPNKRQIAMVFQNYALFPHLNVWENIAFGLRAEKRPDREIRERVQGILELTGLEGLERRMPGELSGGQQQRVALARALVKEPGVLLLDEPLSNLDANLRAYMRGEIRRIQQQLSITSVYVTHDQIEAMSLSDRIAIMNQGRIEQVGTPEEIYERPLTEFVAKFMGKVNLLGGRVIGSSGSSLIVDVLNLEMELPLQGGRFKNGDPVLIVLRPEAVKLCATAKGNLTGTVRRCSYLGSFTEYEIELQEGTIHVLDYNPKIYREGQRVGVRFIKRRIHVLPRKEGF